MNVASSKLCKELYELSGWTYPEWENTNLIPDYDLGYLLRKLPNVYISTGKDVRGENTQMLIEFGFGIDRIRVDDDNPEDAACKLAIELFKQGVLTREIISH